jgi:ADP-heptose:LPS heptosyltransferase
MHLLETYALATGSKIKKPFINKKFFPVPFEKYITIQNSSGMQGKCYDYFQDVVDFIHEDLEKIGYKIIQIGSKDDRALKHVFHLQGQTNINQTAFILENSKLHVGNDSFAIHMCSAFGVPLIGLYSVSSPEIAGPFWKDNNQNCLTPENLGLLLIGKPRFIPATVMAVLKVLKFSIILSVCLLYSDIDTSFKVSSILSLK